LNHFEIDPTVGIDNQYLCRQKEIYGTNEIPKEKSKTLFSIFSHQFANPLVYLLLLAAVGAFALGKIEDAIVILVVVLINSLIGSIQEGKAEKSLASLRTLSKLKALVLRNSVILEIFSSEVVPGDIVKLKAGDAVPADGRLIELANLTTSEAALTGESLPVQKVLEKIEKKVHACDQLNMVFSGTHVLSGRAVMIVTSIGLETEIGKIAHLTATTEDPPTPLEKKIKVFSHKIIIIAFALLFVVIATGIRNGMGFSEILMIAISQLVGLIPEGLPIAVTVALAVGVQRMAKKGAIVRKLSAVETLGSTTVICSDKTGTLTKNQMTAVKVITASGEKFNITGSGLNPDGEIKNSLNKKIKICSEELTKLIYACILCNDASLINNNDGLWLGTGDPTETALLSFAIKAGFNPMDVRKKHKRLRELPFDSKVKIMITENYFSDRNISFIKGAPEKILQLSDQTIISKVEFDELNFSLHKMFESGLRVLGFGFIDSDSLLNLDPDELKGRIHFLGFVGEIDPPRDEVSDAIQSCIASGIRPIMVTGDHKITGLSIARFLGLADVDSKAIEGCELDKFKPNQLEIEIENVSVFARIRPIQKFNIVETLQSMGHVVAMTGDGVNDAPALSRADVGVAMGITGTEVAKQASEIIITDDNFSTIITAIEEGRIVYGNLKKVILYLISTSIAEVAILLLALFSGLDPPLAAVQILWINLVTEGLITVNLILEPGEGNEMKRPPVNPLEPLLSKDLFFRLIFLASSIIIITFGWYSYRTHIGIAHKIAQTETFTLLALTQWFNVLNCRSSSKSALTFSIFKNRWLIAGLLIGIILQFFVVYWRPLGDIFHTHNIELNEVIILGILASFVMWFEEIRKIINKRLK